MKKGAEQLLTGKLGVLILLLASIAVLLIVLWPVIQGYLEGAEEFASREAQPKTITKEDLEVIAGQRLVYKGEKYDNVQELLESFDSAPPGSQERLLGHVYDSENPNAKLKWAFSKILADYLLQCALKSSAQAHLLASTTAIGEASRETICLPCYHIRLAPDVRPLLYSFEMTSAGPEYYEGNYNFMFEQWLKANNPLRSEDSYYTMITSTFNFPPELYEMESLVAAHDNLYKALRDPNEEIAVVFAYIPRWAGDPVRVEGLSGKSGNIYFTSLYPYGGLSDVVLARYVGSLEPLGISIYGWEEAAKCYT